MQANQNKELQGSQRYIGKVEVLKDKAAGSSNPQSNSSIKLDEKDKSSYSSKCGFCGLQPNHVREQCPANKSTCRKCQKKGHWAVVCRKNKVRSIHLNNFAELEAKYNSADTDLKIDLLETVEDTFLGSITIDHNLEVNHIDSSEWVAPIFVSKLNN